MTRPVAQTFSSFRTPRRCRGAAAVLAMMFLMVFGSLAAAMAIVAEGNLRTADTHLKVNRALATAESGMAYMAYRLDRVTTPTPDDKNDRTVLTRDGKIDPQDARRLWLEGSDISDPILTQLYQALAGDEHFASNAQPTIQQYSVDDPAISKQTHHVLTVPAIRLRKNGPTFRVTIHQHPIPNSDPLPEKLREHYGNPALTPQADEPRAARRYNQSPYDGSTPSTGITDKVSRDNRLDARFIRISVHATAGKGDNAVTRTISKDFRIDKRIPYAILSRSRIMIGRNVNIDGPVGSRFLDTDTDGGHPIQMLNDFGGLNSELDKKLSNFIDDLISNDTITPDNRLAVGTAEAENVDGTDVNGDGYIDEFDYFLSHYDTDAEGESGHNAISRQEFNPTDDQTKERLFDLMNRWATPNDGNAEVINFRDQYAKIDGEVHIRAERDQWNNDFSSGAYQDAFRGMIRAPAGGQPIEFGSSETEQYKFGPDDLQFQKFRDETSELSASPDTTVQEAVPYGADNPYDIYTRPKYVDRTFENVRIPRGTNALFVRCTFKGVTYVETLTDNTMDNFNIAGTREPSGHLKYPGRRVTVDGTTYKSSKQFGNNIRFKQCDFKGPVITATPQSYTHMRNKLSFTGETEFELDEAVEKGEITEKERRQYRRSLLLAPHFSVEIGQVSPVSASTGSLDRLNLTGTIVAGLIDMRGNITVNGSIVNTFLPSESSGPVRDGNSQWFNTTLGYFSSEQGDKEAGSPGGARGKIRVNYRPSIPLPDGIQGPVEVRPLHSTYWEES